MSIPGNESSGSGPSRRQFMHRAATVAGVAAATGPITTTARGDAQPSLPTVPFGEHRITRLILGGNPIYGHSHFNRLYSQTLRRYHTSDRVMSLLRRSQEVGIHAWQNSYTERTLADLLRHRREGGTMNWILLGKTDWARNPGVINEVAKLKPLGISQHGHLVEQSRREKQLRVVEDLLKRTRDTGVMVGFSCHNPQMIEIAEERGWDVDFYMTSMYYMNRTDAMVRKILGDDLPYGEKYLPSDPPRMCKMIRQTRKPCLAFKTLAAGRRSDSPAAIRQALAWVYDHIKPTDALILGMYNQESDQVGQDADIVRSILTPPTG